MLTSFRNLCSFVLLSFFDFASFLLQCPLSFSCLLSFFISLFLASSIRSQAIPIFTCSNFNNRPKIKTENPSRQPAWLQPLCPVAVSYSLLWPRLSISHLGQPLYFVASSQCLAWLLFLFFLVVSMLEFSIPNSNFQIPMPSLLSSAISISNSSNSSNFPPPSTNDIAQLLPLNDKTQPPSIPSAGSMDRSFGPRLPRSIVLLFLFFGATLAIVAHSSYSSSKKVAFGSGEPTTSASAESSRRLSEEAAKVTKPRRRCAEGNQQRTALIPGTIVFSGEL